MQLPRLPTHLSPRLQQYWSRAAPYRYIPVAQFAEAFQQCAIGQQIAQELSEPFDPEKGHPLALLQEKYALKTWDMLRGSFQRELTLMKRNIFLYQFRTAQVRHGVQGLCLCTVPRGSLCCWLLLWAGGSTVAAFEQAAVFQVTTT